MATLKPFKGVRPVPQMADQVASPPYDVMSPAEARELVRGNKWSFLHVIKSEVDLPEDTYLYDNRVYEKAKENLDYFEQENVLITDAEPRYYLYRQVINGHVQTGVVGAASVHEYFDGTIKIHEQTTVDKEQDRINHMETCNAHTEPIFMFYHDYSQIDAIVESWISSHEPCYDFVSNDQVQHVFWVVDDLAVIEELESTFEEIGSFYVADGHHRTAAAAKVAKMRQEATNGSSTGNEPFNSFLAVMFPSKQVNIIDYNRVVQLNGLSSDQLIDKIKESFEVSKASQNGSFKPSKRHQFGMYLDGEWYQLEAKSTIVEESDSVKSLDVYILQNNLLTPILGIENPRTDKRIDFVGGARGLGELEKRCSNGCRNVAFALYPTSIDELMSVANANLLMPPKSTWFEPKLRSGLIIHKLDE
ncbi:MAG: DUF1015 domain-containing protein [Anaerolineae bacterium]|nr:DUF1015 domain-containing protein [Anaerolineae bacterium]